MAEFDVHLRDYATAALKKLGIVGNEVFDSLIIENQKLNITLGATGARASVAAKGIAMIGGKATSVNITTSSVHKLNAGLAQTNVLAGRANSKLGKMAVLANVAGQGRLAGTLGRGQSLLSMGGMAGGGGLALGIAGGVLIGGGLMAAGIGRGVMEGGNFEKAMDEAGAVARATDEQKKALQAAVLKDTRESKFKPIEGAAAATYLGRAGFKPEDTITALPSVLQLAQAGVMDLGRTADLATNILTGFNIPVKEFEATANLIASASTRGNVSIEEMAETMKFAAPTAQAAGIALKDVAAATVLLGDAGLKGGISGRGLRGLFGDLLKDDIVKKLRKYQIEVKKTTEGHLDIIETIKEFEKYGKMDVAKILASTFSKNVGTALGVLITAGSDRVSQLGEVSAADTEALKRLSHEMSDNLPTAIDILKGKISSFTIEGTEPLQKPIQRMVETMGNFFEDQDVISGFRELNTQVGILGGHLKTISGLLPLNVFGEAGGGLLELYSDLNKGIGVVVEGLQKAQDFLSIDIDAAWMASKIPVVGHPIAYYMNRYKGKKEARQLGATREMLKGGGLGAMAPKMPEPYVFGSESAKKKPGLDLDDTTDDDKKTQSIRGGIIINIETLQAAELIKVGTGTEAANQTREDLERVIVEVLQNADAYIP